MSQVKVTCSLPRELTEQIRTLSARRLGVRLGTLVDAGLRHQLRTAIRVYVDLET